MELTRCECPDASFEHSAGRCDQYADRRVARSVKGGVVRLNVCCNCTFTGDRRLDVEVDN